jgi:hypothetical protein
MAPLDTTATFEGPEHLRLAQPVDHPVSGKVRVIVLFPEPGNPDNAKPDFRSAIGSYYREHPAEPLRDSSDWLKELREGEQA